ncbi:alpha/beta fold hydrolase [Mycobacterium sp. 1164985.4]|uniref:thioesterase II family protein n=1 Tax=Mycobacterium sp. 1164985.4 TaxID=1834069 RepID=UPI0009ED81C7|nr:alpha/beta fold hydrolase [Mycobacterium sp. 1164985.4]
MKRVKLFCFPHAGGGASMFKGWQQPLGPRTEVVAVDVAHRERFPMLRDLVDEVHRQLYGELDGPHAFFGHSFGALVAYRLACRRAVAKLRLPGILVLSSYAAPHLPPPLPSVEHLDDDLLATLLTHLGGIPPELGQLPVLRAAATAAARNDLRLCETDEDDAGVVLPCPIHVLGGCDDPLLGEADLDQWRARTSGRFSVQMLPGGHFYLADQSHLLNVLRPLLSEVAMGNAKC